MLKELIKDEKIYDIILLKNTYVTCDLKISISMTMVEKENKYLSICNDWQIPVYKK